MIVAGEDAPRRALDDVSLRQLVHDLGGDGARSLIPKFIAETRTRCSRLEREILAGDLTTAHRNAHSLKSAARTYGAHALADAAAALEEAIANNSTAVIPQYLTAVAAAAADALPALEAWLARLETR